MKIAIEGTIIDTNNIYCIKELIELKDYKDRIHSFYLNIESFNDQTLSIEINGDCLFPRKPNFTWNDWMTNDYERKVDLLRKKATEFRQSIINIWKGNQSEIPQFNL